LEVPQAQDGNAADNQHASVICSGITVLSSDRVSATVLAIPALQGCPLRPGAAQKGHAPGEFDWRQDVAGVDFQLVASAERLAGGSSGGRSIDHARRSLG